MKSTARQFSIKCVSTLSTLANKTGDELANRLINFSQLEIRIESKKKIPTVQVDSLINITVHNGLEKQMFD